MKILHLSTTDIKGGAGVAAYRLHQGLLDSGVDSVMFVQRKYGDGRQVISPAGIGKYIGYLCAAADKLVARIFQKDNEEIISPAIFSSFDMGLIDEIMPDIVHLHWVNGGFLSPDKISKIKKPIIWTMHDMWPFSGVKHYNGTDKSYLTGEYEKNNILDRWVWERKKAAWLKIKNMMLVSPSRWLGEEAKKSASLYKFNVINIPNGINTEIFAPVDKNTARMKYNLPPDKKLILFGAVNPFSSDRKGYKLFIEIAKQLSESESKDKFVLVIFGAEDISSLSLPLPCVNAGKISGDIGLRDLYSAVDMFVAPSLEDNLPNTVMEAMACGIPVAAFDIGGMGDMIENGINGVLAEPFDIAEISKGLIEALRNDNLQKRLSLNARKKVLEKFEISKVAENYKTIYDSLTL